MLRQDEEDGAGSHPEPTGELAGHRRRVRQLQGLAYWGGVLLIAGVMVLFLAISLPDRGRAEQRERDIVATVSAEKTTTAAATATTTAAGPPDPQ